MGKISGNEFFAKAMLEEGVEKIFCYPGATVIDIFDELYKQQDIDMILPRHEQGLIHAAEGYAKSTGKTGVCLVTSGPGAANLVTGIADANADSVPLVCFTGQVPTNLIGNDSFQEIDMVGITRNIAKFTIMVRDRKDLNRVIKEAFFIANSGRPGPVVVDLPKDVMAQLGSDEYPEEAFIRGYRPYKKVNERQMDKAISMMYKAKKPLFLLGGGIKLSGAQKEMTELMEKSQIPVITTIMGRGAVPTTHDWCFENLGMHGNVAANNGVNQCDLLISIGTRFNDRITGKLGTFAPKAKIIHIDVDAASISKNVTVDVPIVGDAKEAINMMLAAVEERGACNTEEWKQTLDQWWYKNPIDMNPKGKIVPKQVMDAINTIYDEPILTTDVGQNQVWATQFFEIYGKRQLITSGGLGTMGFGLPSAIGAALGNPGREIVSISGDGGFQMNIQELATAVTQELPITICVFNNGYLGMVRQWQDLFYERRFSGTCMRVRRSCGNCNKAHQDECPPYVPDLVKLAESYGMEGIRVFNAEDIAPALRKARAKIDAPTLIEFIIEDEELVYPMVKPNSSIADQITK